MKAATRKYGHATRAQRLTVCPADGRIGFVSGYVIGGAGGGGIAGLRDGVLHGSGEVGSVGRLDGLGDSVVLSAD
jgi:hypothetical protein